MIKNIAIIGSGNVATALAKAYAEKNINIVQVLSKNIKNAKKLVAQLASYQNISAISDFKKLTQHVDCVIIAVNDDAIAEVLNKLPFKDKLVVHTSGSVGLSVFKGVKKYGVFYPLQTFSNQNIKTLTDVPFCIEGNSETTKKKLIQLAKQVSNQVTELNSEQRKALHLAAVFANNFSNYMYIIAEEITSKNKLDFNLLKPLILETAKKIITQLPKQAQTGPAKRHDFETLSEHLKLLENEKELQEIYSIISNRIMNQF